MKKEATSKKSRTAWKRVNAMTDREIDLSDSPELTPQMFRSGYCQARSEGCPAKDATHVAYRSGCASVVQETWTRLPDKNQRAPACIHGSVQMKATGKPNESKATEVKKRSAQIDSLRSLAA
jgi:hypothetical protein